MAEIVYPSGKKYKRNDKFSRDKFGRLIKRTIKKGYTAPDENSIGFKEFLDVMPNLTPRELMLLIQRKNNKFFNI